MRDKDNADKTAHLTKLAAGKVRMMPVLLSSVSENSARPEHSASRDCSISPPPNQTVRRVVRAPYAV